MERNEIHLDENYDWQATRAIFCNDVVSEKKNGEAILQISLNCQQLLAFRILEPERGTTSESKNMGLNEDQDEDEAADEYWINPRFQYLVLSEIDDPPRIQLTFQYSSSDCEAYPDSIQIEIIQYPKLWPLAEKELWTDWMTDRANPILHSGSLLALHHSQSYLSQSQGRRVCHDFRRWSILAYGHFVLY